MNTEKVCRMKKEKDVEIKTMKNLKGRLICLSGIDGTGKTTIAMRLKEELTSSGIKCKYVWFRNARFLCLPFLALCYLTGFAESVKIDENRRVGVYHFYKNRLITHLWIWISILDILSSSLWKVYLPLKRGYTVIADRYILDALVDLMCDTKINNLEALPFKFLLALLPREAVTFIFDANVEEAFKRKNDTLSLEYIKERQKVYLKLSQEFKIPVIETDKSLNIVWESLLHHLKMIDEMVKR